MKKRFYVLVPYQLSGIQKGIQAGHVGQQYCLEHGHLRQDPEIWKFLTDQKTWYVLNGGTTNDGSVLEDGTTYVGSMNMDLKELQRIKHPVSFFREPDLGNIITAIGFLVDETVFNKEDYPDFSLQNWRSWVEKKASISNWNETSKEARDKYKEVYFEEYEKYRVEKYKAYVDRVGETVAVLKSIVNTKSFA